jgi:hypothetical protein
MPKIQSPKPIYYLEERIFKFAKADELKKIFSSIVEKSK